MPTERITFAHINCSVLADATAADELCEAMICKIEADLGDTEGQGLDPAIVSALPSRQPGELSQSVCGRDWERQTNISLFAEGGASSAREVARFARLPSVFA